MTPDTPQFSVYWWDALDNQHEELRFVAAEAAMRAVKRLTLGPAAILGAVNRVIITDGGDCCCFEWKKDQGIVFPNVKGLNLKQGTIND